MNSLILVNISKAEEKAKEREEREKKEKLENQWMLPSISQKIDKMSSSAEPSKSKKKKTKKSKKVKKEKKSKKKKKKRSASSSSDSSSAEEKIQKRKKRKKKFSESNSSSSNDSNDGQWIEKGASNKTKTSIEKSVEPQKLLVRDDWLGGLMLPTFSKNDINPPTAKKEEKRGLDAYDPAKSALELNPHWKTGSGGLPTFQKPANDFNDRRSGRRDYASTSRSDNYQRSSGWRKNESSSREQDRHSRRSRSNSRSRSRRSRSPRRRHARCSSTSLSRSRSPSPCESDALPSSSAASNLLTDQEIHDLAASQIKAEISGNSELAKELEVKLEKAREQRKAEKNQQSSSKHGGEKDEDVLLTLTNSKGATRPLQNRESDLWGGRAGRKAKKQKVETHIDGERVRYFADDDKYDIKQMVRGNSPTDFKYLHISIY